MKRLIAILAKEPRPGRVKTRLAADVGEGLAASLAEAFLLDTIDVAERVPNAGMILSFDPPTATGWFEAHAPAGASVSPQPEGDLGERMQAVFDEAFAGGGGACVVIGMDTPQLSPGRLTEALDACEDGKVVLGPSLDGGYYLIGMDRPHPALFWDMPWSSDAVLAETTRRLEALGAPMKLLTEEQDVDDLVGLENLDPARLGARSRAALSAFRSAR